LGDGDDDDDDDGEGGVAQSADATWALDLRMHSTFQGTSRFGDPWTAQHIHKSDHVN